MSDKKVSRDLVEKLWHYTWFLLEVPVGNDELDRIIQKKIATSKEIDDDLWVCFIDLAAAVYGLKENATVDDLVSALEALGWQVTDDGEEA